MKNTRKLISILTVICFIFSLVTGIFPATKVQAAEEATVIDLSHENPNAGYTLGTNDEVERWQTFTTLKDGRLDEIGIYLTKKGQAQTITDLVLNLYATDNGKPKGTSLKKVVVPLASVQFGAETKVRFDYSGLVAGSTYAIAATQATLALNGLDNCYQWPTKDIGAKEKFGKTIKDSSGNLSFVDESFLGTGWLKLYTTAIVQDGQVPTTIAISAAKTILKSGETATVAAVVKDQKGVEVKDTAVVWSSNKTSVVTVDSTGKIAAVSGGSATITATYQNLTASVNISVENADGTVIPTPGMVITKDTKFAPGEYDFSSQEGIIIGADNLTIDGNGAVLKGGYDRVNTPASGEYEFYSTKAGSEASKTMKTKTQIDLTGKTKASLEYDIWYNVEDGWDAAMVQISEDGENWTSLNTPNMKQEDQFDGGAYPAILNNLPGYTGKSNDWLHENIDLSQYVGKKVYIQFRYMTDWATEEQGVYVDGVKVKADGDVILEDDAENGMGKWTTDAWTTSNGKLDKPGFKGTGIKSEGHSGITLKNATVKGFNLGLYVSNGSNWTIDNNNFSDNFTDPDYGWGDPYNYGAVMLESVNNSTIKNNKGNNVWTGLYLKHSNKNTVEKNDFSHNSNVCLKMWNASENVISDNNMSYGIRIAPGEVHARDSTSQLMESGSNNNKFYRNDFTHGGDGIFIRVLNGFCSTGNYFEENDASYANNNAVESWSSGNTYVRNKANHSSYGFWLGGSDDTVMIGNEAAFNGREIHNAPEAFGNAGVSVVNGSSSNFKLIGNNIHDNYGPGVAIRYDADYPASHWVIQNNIIKDNKTSTYNSSHKGYGIYLKNAKWVDIAGNQIVGNDAAPIFQDANVSDVFIREAALNDKAPTAKLKVSSATFKIGQEITFDASESSDPNKAKLGFRWDLGDGTIEASATVKHVFTKAGFYRVGVTVNNGKLADLASINVYVVDDGKEIGTETNASNWSLTSDDSNAKLTNENTYFVDGEKSIHVNSSKGLNTLVYPKAKNLALDLSKKQEVSFNVKYESEADTDWGQTNKKPVVRLYQDDKNYFEYVPGTAYLEQIFAADAARSPRANEYRIGWRNLSFNFNGSNGWSMTKVGNPLLTNINYISINEGPSNAGMSDFWVDGLKFTKAPEYVYSGANLAINKAKTNLPAPIYSYKAENSNEWAPLSGNNVFNGGSTARWSSVRINENIESDWYGVDFGTPREVNRLDVYFYNNPSGNLTGDLEGKPQSYTVEYFDGTNWKAVMEAVKSSVEPTANLNRITFNTVNTSKLRVVFKNQPTKYSSIYAFEVYNTNNIASEKNVVGLPLIGLKSSVIKEASLLKVGIWIAASVALDNAGLSDYVVEVYKTDGSGNPTGSVIATATLPKANIKINEENIIDISYVGLKPGTRYAIVATQKVLTSETSGGNVHYRWPTKNEIAPDEHYGKFAGGSFVEERLGTGWLKVYTDKYTIDYSFSNASGGFGLGHVGEDKRYQTFSTPKDTIFDLIDGSIGDNNGWSTLGSGNSEDFVEISFATLKSFNSINVYFDENSTGIKLPKECKLQYFDGTAWKDVIINSGASNIVKGFNTLVFDKLTTDKVRLVVVNADGASTLVKEIEIVSYLH